MRKISSTTFWLLIFTALIAIQAYSAFGQSESIDMIGVVGPYSTASSHYAHPYAVMSRLNNLDEVSIWEEVEWVEEFTGASRYGYE